MVSDLGNLSINKSALLINPKQISLRWAKSAFSSYQFYFDRTQPLYITKEGGIVLEKDEKMTFSCIANGIFCVNWKKSQVSLRIFVRGHRAIVQPVLKTRKGYGSCEVSTGNFIPSPLIAFINLVDSAKSEEKEPTKSMQKYQDDLDECFESDFEIMFSHNTECFVGSYRPSWVNQGIIAC